jgi:hypothetical protein
LRKQKPSTFSVVAGVVFCLYGLAAAAAAYSSVFARIPLAGKFFNPLGQWGPAATVCWVLFLVGFGLLILYDELG